MTCGMVTRGNAQRQASQWKRRAGTLWCAVLTAVATLGWWYFTLDQDITETLVSRSVVLQRPKVFPVQCSEDYENYKRFPGDEQKIFLTRLFLFLLPHTLLSLSFHLPLFLFNVCFSSSFYLSSSLTSFTNFFISWTFPLLLPLSILFFGLC